MRRGIGGLIMAATTWLILLATPAAVAYPTDPWMPFESVWFDTLSTQQGLPHSVSTAVAQDRQGLIWIGTMGGLVRYDGAHMQVFDVRSGKGGRGGLPDAYVRCLMALPDGGLLVGTNAGGLSRFDPDSNTFRTYPVGPGGTSDHKIYALAGDAAGGVWIATDTGLDHLDLASNTIRHVDTGPTAAARNFSVFQDRAGNLWLGNNRGLFLRRKGSQTFVRPPQQDTAASVLTNQIWALAEDNRGRIWAGSGQAGAAWRDAQGHWHPVPGFNGNQGHGHLPTVRALLPMYSGRMWIGTDGDGILIYRPGDAQFRTLHHDTAINSSLPGDTVRALVKDRSGNIWAATDLGAARTNVDTHLAFAVMPSPFNDHALSDNNVHSLHVDRRGRIWVGLGAGKIDLIDLANSSMRHLRLDGGQAYRDVNALLEAPDGTLWVGSQGLARIDPDTLSVSTSVVPALDNQPVLSLQLDGTSLLIGTYEGVYRYAPASGKLEHFQHDPHDPGSLSGDTVRAISRVGNSIWYATTRGISIDHQDGRANRGFRHLGHDPNDPGSLPQDYVGSSVLDQAGRLWVSTFGGIGVIARYKPDGPYRFRTINETDGLSSDKVNAVLEDTHGKLWVSLSNAIAMIDPTSHVTRNLNARDGLHIRNYLSIAAARTPSGDLLFGGLGGLTVIQPNGHETPPAPAPVAITSAVINGKSLDYGKLPRANQTIEIDAHTRSLQLDYALLDYRAPQETTYSYRLDGFDSGWTTVSKGSLPSAIYTNIPHGSYTLQLRARTHGLLPRTLQTTLRVVVAPRWYETAWTRIAALACLVALMTWLVQLRTRYLRGQARRLQRQVDARTHDLQAANRRLDHLAGTDELTGVYNRRRFLSLVDALRRKADNHPMCMALLDLDRFKQVNDTYGHLAGDAVIRAVIGVIQQHCRADDLVGRYGGEELLMCLPGLDLDQVMPIAERIRAVVADTIVTYDDQPIAVTVSIGVTALHPGEPMEKWLARADTALYEAKNTGRDRCVRVD